MLRKSILPLFTLLILLSSCGKNPEYRSYHSTLFVNNGTSGGQSADITSYDADSLKMESRSFHLLTGDFIPGYIHNTTVDDYGILYILTSVPDNVIAADIYSFETYSASLLDTLTNPRSITSDGWFMYISNQGNEEENISPYVSVYSIQNKYMFLASIPVGPSPEAMYYYDDYIYLATGQGVDIINTSERKVVKNIGSEYGKIKMFAGGMNNTLYASCPGNGILIIDMTQNDITGVINAPVGESGDISTNYAATYLYSYSGSTVYKTNVNGEVSSSFFTGSNISGLGVSPFSNQVYIANNSGKEIKILTEDGVEKDTQIASGGDFDFIYCSFVVEK